MQLLARILEAYPVDGVRHTLTFAARGQSNPLGVWRLATDQGAYAVKLRLAQPGAHAVAIEALAHRAGVPMPAPLQTHAGAWFLTVDAGLVPDAPAGASHVYVRLHEWIDGRAFDWGTVDAGLAGQVGALMAAVHQMTVPADLLREDRWSPPGEAGWLAIQSRARAQGVIWAEALVAALPALLAHEAFVAAHDTAAPCVPSQRDYHPPNVLLRPDGTLALVDWDAAGPATASADVVKFADVWSTPERGPRDPHAHQAFIDGYRAAGGVFVPRGAADHVPGSIALLHWIHTNLTRDLDPAGAGDHGLSLALLQGVHPTPTSSSSSSSFSFST